MFYRYDSDSCDPNYSLLHCQNSESEASEFKTQPVNSSQTAYDTSSNSSSFFSEFTRDKYTNISKPAILARKVSVDHSQKPSNNNTDNTFQKTTFQRTIPLLKKQVSWTPTNVDVASTLADLGMTRPFTIPTTDDADIIKENSKNDANVQNLKIGSKIISKDAANYDLPVVTTIDNQLVAASLNHNLI